MEEKSIFKQEKTININGKDITIRELVLGDIQHILKQFSVIVGYVTDAQVMEDGDIKDNASILRDLLGKEELFSSFKEVVSYVVKMEVADIDALSIKQSMTLFKEFLLVNDVEGLKTLFFDLKEMFKVECQDQDGASPL